MLGRVVAGESGITVGYVMPVGGGQFEALLMVGAYERESAAYRRVMQVATVMQVAAEEAAREESENG